MTFATPHLTLTLMATAAVLAACGQKDPAPAAPMATAPAAAPAQACGSVTVANMNWQSAEVLAHIDKIILTKAYGCNVELLPGDTMPTPVSRPLTRPSSTPSCFRRQKTPKRAGCTTAPRVGIAS